jgi:hypothetical protein
MTCRRSLSTVLLFAGLVWVILVLPLMTVGPAFADPSWDLWDWQQQHKYLKDEVDRVTVHAPPDLKSSTRPYIRALEELDALRKQALEGAQEVQASKDPKIRAMFDDFMDVVDFATGSGNMFLWLTESTLFRWYGPQEKRAEARDLCDAGQWILQTELYGNELYAAAKQLNFDHTIVRRLCQALLERALECIEQGDSYVPSWLWPFGCVSHKIDWNLVYLDKVRKQGQFFELAKEKQKAEELMNKYLKDALCYRKECIGHPPPGYPHKWYLDKAKQYKLLDAISHIEGFYATIYGKVEVKNNGGREPAPGASVRVFSPKDKQEWKTNADANGKYRIKGVILHKKCSPFMISAEYQGDRVDTSYTGPLSEPDSSYEYEKDLFIDKKRRPDTATLKGKYYYHRSTAKQKETKEIEATVRLKLKAFSADLCEVVSTEVISFSGKEEGFYDGEKRVDYQLVSASVWVPPSLGKATIGGITLKRDEKTKKVIAAQLPIIILDLEWSGCCDTTPEEKLTIGPVTEEDKEEKKRKRNEMRKMRRESRKDLSRLAAALWGTFHEDFKVKTGNGINRFGGSGEDVKQRKTSITKKNYEWEIYLKKK